MKGGMSTTPSLREQRAAAAESHHNTKKTSTGCLPSIFFFFQRHHHSHSRKRIASASGKKADNNKAVEPVVHPPPPPPKQQPVSTVTSNSKEKKVALKRAGSSSDVARSSPSRSGYRRLTCDVPRSPTIPAEIRRPITSANSAAPPPLPPESPKKPPALVARLMGLEEMIPVGSPPDSVAEKRRKLLGALEKCDEDLKALKQIIDAVRLEESRKLSAVTREILSAAGDCEIVEKRMCPEQQQQPHSATVFKGMPGSDTDSTQTTTVQPSRKLEDHGEEAKRRRRSEDDKGASSTGCAHFFRLEGLPRRRGGRGSSAAAVRALVRKAAGRWKTVMRSSKAMAESVAEVWEDGVREERWEYGRVGVALEGDIFGDLVEEVVGEMDCSAGRRRSHGAGDAIAGGRSTARRCYSAAALPFDACRRRLRF